MKHLILALFLCSFAGMKILAKPNTNLDLNDEKDDGTDLALPDSENHIVPPEEDEDQTDDQAIDSDKSEDLEDLKHLGTIYVNRNSEYISTSPLEASDSSITSDDNDKSLYIDYYYKDDHTGDERNEASKNYLRELKVPEVSDNDEYNENSPLTHLNDNIEEEDKEWMHYYNKEKPGDKWQKTNQILMIVIIFQTALIILAATISIVLLVKLKVKNRKQNKRRLHDKLIDYDDPAYLTEV